MKKSAFLGCSAAAALMISHAADAATLRGRVLDAAHNAALPGATVTLSTGAATVTGDDGRFEFPATSPKAAQQVTVDYVGFARASQSLTAPTIPPSPTSC